MPYSSIVLTTATKAPLQPVVVHEDDNLTVEQFLEKKFEGLAQVSVTIYNFLELKDKVFIDGFPIYFKELRDHAEDLVARIRKQYADGAAAIQAMVSIAEDAPSVCVTLKVIAGPHIGQKFRLEANPVRTHD